MGDHQGLGGVEHGNDEIPLHRVRVDAFHIGATEVTNADYVAFLNGALGEGSIEVVSGLVRGAGGGEVFCETRGAVSYSRVGWTGSGFNVLDGRESHPMVGVRWFGAAAYANWLTRRAGLAPCYDLTTGSCDLSSRGYRLPTEAEWEYAARGGLADPYRLFPWGDDPDPARANWPGSGDPFEAGSYPWTTPVGFYNGQLRRKAEFAWPSSAESYQTANGANAYGLHDTAGNVWEWVHDWYGRDYYAESPPANPPGPTVGSPMPDGRPYRCLRGGNWYNGQWGHSRVSNRNPSYYRGPDDPNHAWYHVGFRVAFKGSLPGQ
jgi:formylglycine-generating enzyme required for sulfatase activity